MSVALVILTIVVLLTPAMLFFGGTITQEIVAAFAAALLAIVAARIRQGEASFLFSVCRVVAVLAAIPTIWMLFQLLPLQGLANSIWKSAAAALDHRISGSISIDPGATLISLVQFLSIAAIFFVATALAVDRQRARWLLVTLTSAATIMALMILISKVNGFPFLEATDQERLNSFAAVGASLGAIFAAAATLLSIDSDENQKSGEDHQAGTAWPGSFICLIAFAICVLAILVRAAGEGYYILASGLVVLAAAVIIRRYNFGPWGIAAIVSASLLVVVAAVVVHSRGQSPNLTIGFASLAPAPLISVTQRILTDTNWFGTGAGTFAAILPIYQGIGELDVGHAAPTAAAAIAVEMGWPLFFVLFASALALIFILLRGSIRRRRNSYYAMAGAGCLVAAVVSSFYGVALLFTPISILIAVAIGASVGQSKSSSEMTGHLGENCSLN